MSFKHYKWKNRYISSKDDVLSDFFIPALAHSKYYYRIAGYFSSSVLAAASRGVTSFITNGEVMKLAVSAELSKDDAQAINEGEKAPEKVLETNLRQEFEDISDAVQKDRLAALSWMISLGQLEIRIGVNLDLNGNVLPKEKSLWHEKVILFEDEAENFIHIDGSVNETMSGWTSNRESFSVHKSWIKGQKGYVSSAQKEFRDIWEGKDERSKLFSIPEAIKNRILDFKTGTPPKNDPMILKKDIELWPPQQRAINRWTGNNYRGIFEMATGTGKTLASLFAAHEIFREQDFLLILVPFKALIDQWEKEIRTSRNKFLHSEIIKCSSDYSWKAKLGDFILRNKTQNRSIIIATMDTAITTRFMNILEEYVNPDNLILIVDEVHNIGSSERKKFLDTITANRGRIGLSATPERYWDEEGTQAIFEYFEGKVIEYGIEKAIDPEVDGQRFLSPYEYYIHFVPLNEKERRKYNKITSQIVPLYAKVHNIEDNLVKSKAEEKLARLLIKRARILKKAKKKISMTIDIIKNSNDLDRTLIYCSDNDQLTQIKDILLDLGENVCQYTSELDTSQRDDALRNFRDGITDTMVAIKCLDEGVDIPVCDSAIILSSSRNSREFVQRRGRVLRKYQDKEKAKIHDLVVLPYKIENLKDRKYQISEAEYRIIKKELERVETFRKTAINSSGVLVQMQDIKSLLEQNKNMN